MSLLDTKNKKELLDIARTLLVEVPSNGTKEPTVKEIRAALAEAKVTDEDVANLEIVPEPSADAPLATTADGGTVTTTSLQAQEAEPEPVLADPDAAVPTSGSAGVLLHYSRQNPSYQVKHYKFSREHPFAVVSKEDADYIVRNIPGFRPALESEVAEFYS